MAKAIKMENGVKGSLLAARIELVIGSASIDKFTIALTNTKVSPESPNPNVLLHSSKKLIDYYVDQNLP
jgi:hypothetical protein